MASSTTSNSYKAKYTVCIICDCNQSQPHEKRQFYRFPKDPELKKKWVDFCVTCGVMIPNDINFITSHVKICSLHFDEKYISKKKLLKNAVPTILDSLSTDIHNSQIQDEHCYTIKTEKLSDDEEVDFVAKPKLENLVDEVSNIDKRSDNKMLQKSLIKTSVEKYMPTILKKVPPPFLNTKKYDAIRVDQEEVLNSLNRSDGNIDSSENPIIFKLDIAKSMDVIKNTTLHMKKVVEQNDITKTTVAKRKLDPGELDLEKIPTKVVKLGSQSSIKLIKTVPNQNANLLVADNSQMNTSNRNMTAKIIRVVKSPANSNITGVSQNSSEAPILSSQAKKLQINSNVLTSTDLNKKVDMATSQKGFNATKSENQPKILNPISKKNELKKVDPPLPLNSTVIDLTEQTPISSSAIQPSSLEAADLNATSFKCLVPECLGRKFFRVPNISKLVLIWQICLLKTEKKRSSNPFSVEQGKLLCERHFLTEDFEEIPENGKIGVLKKHAVPSLYPVCSGCIIPGCVNHHRNTSNMYSIPVWRKCTLWLEYLPHLKDYSPHKLLTYRVCEEHFEVVNDSNMFSLVPSKNLPSLEMLENLRANKLAVNPENLCAFLLCGRLKQDSTFVPFPKDDKEAMKWLELSFRELILQQDKNKVQKFLTTSGLCPEHHLYILQYLEPNKKKQQLEYGISNVIDQLPLLAGPIKLQSILKKVPHKAQHVMKTPTTKHYLPWREYCAFINCATHIKFDTRVKKFKFPTDSQIYYQWKEAAGIHASITTDLSNYFVCGKHFTPDQFNSCRKLKMDSVPQGHWLYKDENAHFGNLLWVRKLRVTRLPPIPKNDSEDSKVTKSQKLKIPDSAKPTQQENLKLLEPQQQKVQISVPSAVGKPIAKCCVKNCKVDASNKLLPFPSQLPQKELFAKAVLNTPSVNFREMNFRHICTRHFRREDLVNGTAYKPNAVPTLYLNHETDGTEISNQDTIVVWDKIEEQTVSQTPCHPRKMVLQENCIEFPSVNSRLKFGKDCPKIGVNRYPFDIKQPLKNAFSSLNPGHELQLDAAFVIDDDDDSERTAITLLCNTIKSNDDRAKRLIDRLNRLRRRQKHN